MKFDIMGNRKRTSYKKGQAVMEYLITYGLALFIIVLVLAILVAVVLPSLTAPEECGFTQQGFTCNQKQHVLVADASNNVRLLFQLDNTQGRNVKIYGVLCTDATTGNVNKTEVENYGYWLGTDPGEYQPLAAGQSFQFGGTGDEVMCKKPGGAQIVLSPNSNFRGTLAVVYGFEDEVSGAPTRISVATLSGNVQAQ